jgi:hypothetical protein
MRSRYSRSTSVPDEPTLARAASRATTAAWCVPWSANDTAARRGPAPAMATGTGTGMSTGWASVAGTKPASGAAAGPPTASGPYRDRLLSAGHRAQAHHSTSGVAAGHRHRVDPPAGCKRIDDSVDRRSSGQWRERHHEAPSSTLRNSHSPDPPTTTLEPQTPTPLDKEGCQVRRR